MREQTLYDYIVKARTKQMSEATIRENLLNAGWDSNLVTAALDGDMTVPVPIPSPAPHISTMKTRPIHLWESFEYILYFISLYVTAISGGLVLNTLVDTLMTTNDTSSYYSSYTYDWNMSLLRAQISVLIVSFPIFATLFLYLKKVGLKDVVLRYPRIVSTLVYLTLIVSFVTLLGAVIYLVFTVLNGKITFNMFMHFFVTACVSGLVFFYYTREVRLARKQYEPDA